jgi:hypothetical protein
MPHIEEGQQTNCSQNEGDSRDGNRHAVTLIRPQGRAQTWRDESWRARQERRSTVSLSQTNYSTSHHPKYLATGGERHQNNDDHVPDRQKTDDVPKCEVPAPNQERPGDHPKNVQEHDRCSAPPEDDQQDQTTAEFDCAHQEVFSRRPAPRNNSDQTNETGDDRKTTQHSCRCRESSHANSWMTPPDFFAMQLLACAERQSITVPPGTRTVYRRLV